MKYLLEPDKGIFVGIREDFSCYTSEPHYRMRDIRQLKLRAFSVQAWFVDLDDNLCDSPAKDIAKNAVGTSHFSLPYLSWAFHTALQLARHGKKAESETWNAYVQHFLRSPEALDEVQKRFTPATARQSLYSGVLELYPIFSHTASCHLVTRNIKEVADAYTQALRFDGNFPEAENKGRVVEDFILKNPTLNYFGVDGDSQEDAEMIDVLKFHGRKTLGIYSMRSHRETLHPSFDVGVSKNRTGLVSLLTDF